MLTLLLLISWSLEVRHCTGSLIALDPLIPLRSQDSISVSWKLKQNIHAQVNK